MRQGIFVKTIVEVTDSKSGEIFFDLSAKINVKFVAIMLPRPAG